MLHSPHLYHTSIMGKRGLIPSHPPSYNVDCGGNNLSCEWHQWINERGLHTYCTKEIIIGELATFIYVAGWISSGNSFFVAVVSASSFKLCWLLMTFTPGECRQVLHYHNMAHWMSKLYIAAICYAAKSYTLQVSTHLIMDLHRHSMACNKTCPCTIKILSTSSLTCWVLPGLSLSLELSFFLLARGSPENDQARINIGITSIVSSYGQSSLPVPTHDALRYIIGIR